MLWHNCPSCESKFGGTCTQSMPDPSSLPFPGPSRSNSSASTASSSGASLSRRSRITRKRTGTITTSSHRDEPSTTLVDEVLDISATYSLDPPSGRAASPTGTTDGAFSTHPRPGPDTVLASVRSGPEGDRSCTTFGTFGPPIDGHEAHPGDAAHARPSSPAVAPSPETVVSPPTVRLPRHCKLRPTSIPYPFRQREKAADTRPK